MYLINTATALLHSVTDNLYKGINKAAATLGRLQKCNL